jgi:homoserine O-acetyltransferase
MDTSTNSVGEVAPQRARFDAPLTLKSGAVLPAFELVYETYGELNAARSNAVLVCHALSGNHHVAGWHADNPKNLGWWDNLIGPGKPLDTRKFFVVGVNNLGGCFGSTGPHVAQSGHRPPWGADFPVVTVEDWVAAQARLADRLGIEAWAAVIGGSLGGMQAMQWALEYPERIAPRPGDRLGAEAHRAEHRLQRGGAPGHPHRSGFPRRPLLRARRGAGARPAPGAHARPHHLSLRRPDGGEIRPQAAPGGPAFSYDVDFEIESYLRYQGDKFAGFFDANTYLLTTKALDYFDPARDYGGRLAAALARAKAKFLVVSFSTDWRFAPERSREIVYGLVHNGLDVSYAEVESMAGHDSFLLDDPHYHAVLRAYFEGINT